jgi:hypothetical protein
LYAIRRLAAAYPQLAAIAPDGKITMKVRVFKYAGTSTGRILGINGGTPDLSKFMHTYTREIKKFRAPGAQNPVVLLVDNDAGTKGNGNIYNTVRAITKKTLTGGEQFVHIISNLYLVATPLESGKTQSTIEDFFDSTIKSMVVAGKKFDAKNQFETATHYGKNVFAHKVVRVHAEKINFDGFEGILTNIVAVIDEHAKTRSTI